MKDGWRKTSDKKVTTISAQFKEEGGGTADISAQKQIDKLTKKAAPKDGDIFAERNQTVI